MESVILAMVDDNSTVMDTNEAVLRKREGLLANDAVAKFKTADEFLADVEKNGINYYDIVLCDQDLGRTQMKGYEVITEIQKKGYVGKAVLLTADNSESMELRMDLTFDVEYVTKGEPDYIDRLIKEIQSVRQ